DRRGRAQGGRADRRRRGPARLRPRGQSFLGSPATGLRPGRGDHGQADGQRPSGRRGRGAAGRDGRLSRGLRLLQYLRRQSRLLRCRGGRARYRRIRGTGRERPGYRRVHAFPACGARASADLRCAGRRPVLRGGTGARGQARFGPLRDSRGAHATAGRPDRPHRPPPAHPEDPAADALRQERGGPARGYAGGRAVGTESMSAVPVRTLDLAERAVELWGGSEQPPRLVKQRENMVFDARLRCGRRVALRLHRPGYQSRAAITSELWWTRALAERGLPVAVPVPSLAGGLVEWMDDRAVSCVGWLDGAPIGSGDAPLTGTAEAQEALMRQLGRLIAAVQRET